MNESERIALFEQTSALLSGHFLLTSGLHADKYIAKRRLYTHPLKVSALCREIAERFQYQEVEAVVSPAVGGVALSQWVAAHLTELTDCEVLAVFAEKIGDDKKDFGFSEGCGEFLAGKRVLIVDDILTTGGSIDAVRNAVTSAGGTVMGASVLWLRSAVKIDIPFFALIEKTFPTLVSAVCPQCVQSTPFDKLK